MKSTKQWSNRELAQLLREISAAYIVTNQNRFRIRAYEDASDVIEQQTQSAQDLWKKGQLSLIPKIGSTLESHLDELFRTGKTKHFEETLRHLPQGMFPLLEVPGIGPKTAYKLAKYVGLLKRHNAVEKLKASALDKEIEGIDGFGPESQAKILQGIAEWERREDRVLLPIAEDLAQEIIAHLKQHPAVKQIEPLGSLRRRASTVGDIDLAVATNDPRGVIDHFVNFNHWKEIETQGESSGRATHQSGRQVDLKTEPPEQFGSLLQHFTGSKEHNVALREYALTKGLSLSEHGAKKIRTQKGETLLKRQGFTFSNEKRFYNFLGLDWIPPELRENRGEIQAARNHRLPTLIESKDIKGDFHIHSNLDIETSHDLGQSSLEEIVNRAEKLGYQYIAVSDHNPSVSQHKQTQIIDLIKRRNEEIDKFIYSRGKDMKIRILKSLEIDILPDGKRAVPDKVLELLDIAIVSIHSSFRETEKIQTQRILRALDHPTCKILGHPTGRQLLTREGISCDWDSVFDVVKSQNKWIEINANPHRLDLPDDLIKEAVKQGIKLAINTDSHHVDNLAYMNYGVDQARRGWASRKDIANTLSWKELQKLLQ